MTQLGRTLSNEMLQRPNGSVAFGDNILLRLQPSTLKAICGALLRS
jgi:hypothetical protein